MARKKAPRFVDVAELFSGSEPTFKDKVIAPGTETKVIMDTLNWYSKHRSPQDSQKWFTAEFPTIKPTAYINNAGFLVRMKQRGFPAALIQEKIVAKYNEMNAMQAAEKAQPKEEKPKQQKVEQRDLQVLAAINDIDGYIDGVISKMSPAPPQIQVGLLNRKQITELIEFLDKTDSEFELAGTEGYENITTRMKNVWTKFYENLKGAAQAKSKTAVRKVRTKKAVPVEKIIRLFKYQKTYGNYTSATPDKLLGANAAIIFDSKSRKLIFLESKEGFKIERSAITFDPSSKMKTLRKPDETLAAISGQTKLSAKRLFDKLNCTEFNVRPRSQETWVIIRVW